MSDDIRARAIEAAAAAGRPDCGWRAAPACAACRSWRWSPARSRASRRPPCRPASATSRAGRAPRRARDALSITNATQAALRVTDDGGMEHKEGGE